jgi:transposase-like protein
VYAATPRWHSGNVADGARTGPVAGRLLRRPRRGITVSPASPGTPAPGRTAPPLVNGTGAGELTGAGREELQRLRKEVREQQRTIEVLKKAAAFFAEGSDR